MSAKYKVLVTARSFAQSDILEKNGCEVFRSQYNRPLKSEEMLALVEKADAIIAGNDQVDSAVIRAAKRLKVISRYGVGYDNIDLITATAVGIPVTNTPDTNFNSVADLVFALILMSARQIHVVDRIAREGRWDRIKGTEVWEKTLGIIGFGKIGRAVALRAKGFNMNVLVNDPFIDETIVIPYNAHIASREEVLKRADYLSLHVPGSPENKNMIGYKELTMMKDHAILINTARGGLVDEAALVKAVNAGIIGGAALDVLADEPPKDRSLLEAKNILVTTHIGGYTTEAIRAMSRLAAENVLSVLSGKKPVYLVNPEVLAVKPDMFEGEGES